MAKTAFNPDGLPVPRGELLARQHRAAGPNGIYRRPDRF